MTRVCAATGTSGVPVGTQVETPAIVTTGCPCESTRAAPTIHCAVTHGPFPVGATKAHPATAYGAAMVAVGIACPPCAHNTVAPMCKTGPAITQFLSRLLQCGSP